MTKKDLTSLMKSIIGKINLSYPAASAIEQPNATAVKITEEMKTKLEANRRRKVGRPRKGESGSKTTEIRATFIVDPDLIRKVKFIFLVEGSFLKDVISNALTTYIETWETKNGKIRLP